MKKRTNAVWRRRKVPRGAMIVAMIIIGVLGLMAIGRLQPSHAEAGTYYPQ